MDFVKEIKRVWLLTGTPVANRPIDFYNLLRVCTSIGFTVQKLFVGVSIIWSVTATLEEV